MMHKSVNRVTTTDIEDFLHISYSVYFCHLFSHIYWINLQLWFLCGTTSFITLRVSDIPLPVPHRSGGGSSPCYSQFTFIIFHPLFLHDCFIHPFSPSFFSCHRFILLSFPLSSFHTSSICILSPDAAFSPVCGCSIATITRNYWRFRITMC